MLDVGARFQIVYPRYCSHKVYRLSGNSECLSVHSSMAVTGFGKPGLAVDIYRGG
jgi:hypothetical protein